MYILFILARLYVALVVYSVLTAKQLDHDDPNF